MYGELVWLRASRIQEGARVTYGDDRVRPSEFANHSKVDSGDLSLIIKEQTSGTACFCVFVPAKELNVQLIENGPSPILRKTCSVLNDPDLLYPTRRKM